MACHTELGDRSKSAKDRNTAKPSSMSDSSPLLHEKSLDFAVASSRNLTSSFKAPSITFEATGTRNVLTTVEAG